VAIFAVIADAARELSVVVTLAGVVIVVTVDDVGAGEAGAAVVEAAGAAVLAEGVGAVVVVEEAIGAEAQLVTKTMARKSVCSFRMSPKG
jgi:hypothetical protein